tara:strand:- start:3400 stop:3537 length:138 start_codon:yes stop_codon:yes gene_type:complete
MINQDFDYFHESPHVNERAGRSTGLAACNILKVVIPGSFVLPGLA